MLSSFTKISLATLVLLTNMSGQIFAAEQAAVHVAVDTVSYKALTATAELDGTLFSRSHVDITAGVNGQLEWVAEPGSYISQGELMAKMDLLPLELQKIELLAVQSREKVHLSYLKKELNRLEELSKTHAVSLFQLDEIRSKYFMAEADLAIANVKLKQIEDKINRAQITAPFNGVVTARYVREGRDVNRSDSLLKFLDTSDLEVRVFVPVKYLPFINKGDELKITTEQKSVSATISTTIPSTDPKSQTFEVRIHLPEKDLSKWAAGQLVRVSIPIQESSPSLTVSRDALILRKDATYVVKISDNKAQRLSVVVGKGNTERVAIEGNISDGDQVAIRGAERLQEGQNVIIR